MLRDNQKISRKDLAVRLNLSAETVARWERNERSPDAETLKKIALVLNTSVAYLTDETDDPVRHEPSILDLAGRNPEEFTGNAPPPPSDWAKRKKDQLREYEIAKRAEDTAETTVSNTERGGSRAEKFDTRLAAICYENVKDYAEGATTDDLQIAKLAMERALRLISSALDSRTEPGKKPGEGGAAV